MPCSSKWRSSLDVKNVFPKRFEPSNPQNFVEVCLGNTGLDLSVFDFVPYAVGLLLQYRSEGRQLANAGAFSRVKFWRAGLTVSGIRESIENVLVVGELAMPVGLIVLRQS